MRGSFLGVAACCAVLTLLPAASLKADPAQVSPPSKAPMSQAEFHDLVIKSYSIDPENSKDKAYLEAGAARIDSLWNKALAYKPDYAPLLAAELQRDDLPPNFYLDAPLLLALLDNKPEYGRIAAAGLVKVDFAKISLNPGNYVLTANMLMSDGVDTTDAALHFLNFKSDEVMVNAGPHVFFYSKTEALVWMLFGMEEQKFVPKLIARLQTEADNYNLGAIIHALWESVTPEGWAALRDYAKGPCKNKDACAYAREMLAHEGDEPPVKGLVADDLRVKRRKIALRPFGHDTYVAFHKLSDDLAAIAGPRL